LILGGDAPLLDRVLELVVDRKIFRWNRKSLEIKVLAVLIYHAGISYRKVREIFWMYRILFS